MKLIEFDNKNHRIQTYTKGSLGRAFTHDKL